MNDLTSRKGQYDSSTESLTCGSKADILLPRLEARTSFPKVL